MRQHVERLDLLPKTVHAKVDISSKITPQEERCFAMKKSKLTDEQIIFALRQAEMSTIVVEVCRKMGITEATYYNCGGLCVSKLQ